MIQLELCPFCGEQPYFNRYTELIEDDDSQYATYSVFVRVRCVCGACSKSIMYNAKIHGENGEYEEAAAAWNKRAAPGKNEFANDHNIFSQRKHIAEKYKKWVDNVGAKDCPESVLAYLTVHGILNANKINDLLGEGRKNDL